MTEVVYLTENEDEWLILDGYILGEMEYIAECEFCRLDCTTVF